MSCEETQLENLLLALDTKGGSADCVKIKDTFLLVDGAVNHCYELAMCKAYRWPDLRTENACVRRMPFCSSCFTNICLNPFHFSKTIG